MTLEQVGVFIDHVLRHDQKLEKLSLQGGEPSLLPHLPDIVTLLYDKLYPHHVSQFQIDTNGIIPLPESCVNRPKMRVMKSPPNTKSHRCQWVAPKDTGQAVQRCPVPDVCGFCFNAFGYSPCGAGGAIARLFDLPQFYTWEFPVTGERHFGPFREDLCVYCQRAAVKPLMVKDSKEKNPVSKSFKNALEKWLENPTVWPRIGEDKGPRK